MSTQKKHSRWGLLLLVAMAIPLGFWMVSESGYFLKSAIRDGSLRTIEGALLLPCHKKVAIVLDALDSPKPVIEFHATYAAIRLIENGVSVEQRESFRKKLEPKAQGAVIEQTRLTALRALELLDELK
jgi:hypothetical protein